MRDVAAGSLLLLDFLFLKVHRKGDVSNAAIGKGRSARQVGNVLHVGGAHDALVEDGDIHEEFVERHILLGERADQIVKLQSGDRQHGLAVELGVVQTIQQMNAARARKWPDKRPACR